MNLTTRFLPLFGLSLVAVFAVGCAQPGAGLPASPSSVSAGASATAAGPSAGYNASGRWEIANVDPDGNLEDPFVTNVTQDSNGNLHLRDEDNQPITLERLSQGGGAIITYRIAFVGNEGGGCDFRVQGLLQLDTRTDTITGHLRLKQLGCENERQGAGVIGRKL